MKTRLIVFIALLLVFSNTSMIISQEIGDNIEIHSTNPRGVPVHPEEDDNTYVRWANGTICVIIGHDSDTGWYEIESAGRNGWVTPRYIRVIDPNDNDHVENELPSLIVASWNLEAFHESGSRGFPENRYGGPSYGPRLETDYEQIANAINNNLMAGLLILNEINGENQLQSNELNRLIHYLGANWHYRLTNSGG